MPGGEMQLTSIARALVHGPRLLLADEPTGNVNPNVGRIIMQILRGTAARERAGVLMVTHSPEHAAWSDRICFLEDGTVAAELAHGGRRDTRPLARECAQSAAPPFIPPASTRYSTLTKTQLRYRYAELRRSSRQPASERVLAFEVSKPQERDYLAQLATRTGLNPNVVRYIHQSLGVAP